MTEYVLYVIIILPFSHSWLTIRFFTRVTWRVRLVEQELFTLPEHLSSSSFYIGVFHDQSLVFCVVFCRSLFVFLLLAIFCLSLDLQLLITSLVSTNFSYISNKILRTNDFWDQQSKTHFSWLKIDIKLCLRNQDFTPKFWENHNRILPSLVKSSWQPIENITLLTSPWHLEAAEVCPMYRKI
jgi:hypothetical protein